MRIRHLAFTNLIVLVAAATAAFAHPLGNFSVNQYSKIEAGKSKVTIRQVLDLAEIPTFQESSAIDTDKDGTYSDAELQAYLTSVTPAYLANLNLTINGTNRDLR